MRINQSSRTRALANSVTIVLTTVPDRRSGRRIARHLVREKLAACVSTGGFFHSVYRWKGKLEAARETLLIIKTSRRLFSKLEKALKARHPYELPEIIALPVTGGSAEYLRWIEDSVK